MQLLDVLKNSSASDLLARCLGNEGRSGESSHRGGSVDLINKALIERNVYPHGPAGIGKQGNGEQHSSFLDGCFNVLVAENLVYATSRSDMPSCAFQRFRVLAKSSCCVRSGLFQGVACRKASLHVRKPDAECAVRLFFNDGYVLCRHRLVALLSWPPAGQLINPPHKTGRQIFAWMRHGDDSLSFWMLERVVITADSIKNPSILFQHRDQLAAVSFHRPPPKASEAAAGGSRSFAQRRATSLRLGLSRQVSRA